MDEKHWKKRWPRVTRKELKDRTKWKLDKNRLWYKSKRAKELGAKGNWIKFHTYIIAKDSPIPKGYHVHHIDRNPLNNRRSNLAVIPGEVHSLLHTFGLTIEEAYRAWHVMELCLDRTLERQGNMPLPDRGPLSGSLVITKQSLAEELGVDRRTIYRAIESGDLNWTLSGVSEYIQKLSV